MKLAKLTALIDFDGSEVINDTMSLRFAGRIRVVAAVDGSMEASIIYPDDHDSDGQAPEGWYIKPPCRSYTDPEDQIDASEEAQEAAFKDAKECAILGMDLLITDQLSGE